MIRLDQIKEIFSTQGAAPAWTDFSLGDLPFFFRFVRPIWQTGLISLVLALAVSGINSLMPLSSKFLIDFVILKTGFGQVDALMSTIGLSHYAGQAKNLLSSVRFLITALLIGGAFIGGAGIIQGILMIRFQQEITYNLRTSLFEHVLRFPLIFFRGKETGYLTARLSDDIEALQTLFSDSLSQVITQGAYLIFGMALAFLLSVKLTVIFLLILPLFMFINHFFSRRYMSISYAERETSAQVEAGIQETLSGIETVKTHADEAGEVQKASGRIRTALNTRIKGMILSLLSGYAVSSARFISMIVVIWIGADELRKGSMSIGDYVAFTSYMYFISGAVHSLLMYQLMLQPSFASLARIRELFLLDHEFIQTGRTAALLKPTKVEGAVRFKNVSFSYTPGQVILDNISFSAAPGEVIGLSGPSGSGKTTLINLLLKFYQPETGMILLDGRNLQDLDTQWLRQQIAVVSQEVFLFNDTIEKNIRYGNPAASRDDVKRAARMANVHNEIIQLLGGYDAIIGERGLKLSAGQRQRISIARAFIRNAPVLVLDEPTSALDSASEELIKESIKRLAADKTTFLISHDTTLLEIADKVLLIEKRVLSGDTIKNYQEGKESQQF